MDANICRDDLLFGNSGREYNASAGEQAEKISGFKREIEGKAEAERRSYAKELVEKGFTEKVTNGIHQYNLIKAVWQEFVADVFSGMNTYTADYADIVADYWYDGKVIDRYSPAEYNNITDAGGVNNSGNEYSLLNKGKSNRVAVPNKWRPDLSVKKLITLQNDIKNEIKSSKQYVTDGAKWIFTDIDGTDVFAIYSTEDFSEPTILYESKDKRAEIEKTYLLNLLEAVENESVDEKSRIIGEVFGGNWVRLRDSIRDSDKTVGRGSSDRDAGVLQRQSPRKPRKALENVIKNLFEIQGENRRTSGVVNDKDQGRYFLSTDNGNLRYC